MPLTLVAEASRTDQLGGNALQTVAVYAEARPLGLAQLAKADAAEGLRIEVVNDDDAFSPLTRPWRRELVPRLDPAATIHLLIIVGACGRATSCWLNTNQGGVPPSGETRCTALSRAPHGLNGHVPGSAARPAAAIRGLATHAPRMLLTGFNCAGTPPNRHRVEAFDCGLTIVSTKTTEPRSKTSGGTCRRSRSDTSAKSTAMKKRRWMALPRARAERREQPDDYRQRGHAHRPRWPKRLRSTRRREGAAPHRPHAVTTFEPHRGEMHRMGSPARRVGDTRLKACRTSSMDTCPDTRKPVLLDRPASRRPLRASRLRIVACSSA